MSPGPPVDPILGLLAASPRLLTGNPNAAGGPIPPAASIVSVLEYVDPAELQKGEAADESARVRS